MDGFVIVVVSLTGGLFMAVLHMGLELLTRGERIAALEAEVERLRSRKGV